MAKTVEMGLGGGRVYHAANLRSGHAVSDDRAIARKRGPKVKPSDETECGRVSSGSAKSASVGSMAERNALLTGESFSTFCEERWWKFVVNKIKKTNY